ncbi:outer membrane protein [Sphingomonas sp. 22176]|uniref:outer membrane protein n=1 Tax=Sphingomonas sp. 22176 TaxID=3453884 RepID=UPI003F84AB6F
MLRHLSIALLEGLATFWVLPVHAQDSSKGIYAVVRAGGVIQPDQKLDRNGLPTATINDNTKYRTGITGEIGGGYAFGMFRLEQTIGYTDLKLNRDRAETGGFLADGRAKMLSATINGYVDIPLGTLFQPYVGGGIGVARVDARMSRINAATGIGSSYAGKDWGMLWHADAGLGIRVTPKATLEVGARYSRISSLAFNGQNAGAARRFEPQLNGISGNVGLRYRF